MNEEYNKYKDVIFNIIVFDLDSSYMQIKLNLASYIR